MLREDRAVILARGAAVGGHIVQRLQLRQARKKPLELRARQDRPHDGLAVDRRVDRAAVVIRAQAVILPVFIQTGNFQLSGFLDLAHAFYAVNNIFAN